MIKKNNKECAFVFDTRSECCWGRLAFEKKTLALRGRRAALVALTRHREATVLLAQTGPVDDGFRRRHLGSGGDGSGSKPHHRCDLDSWSERRRREWFGCAAEGECVFLSHEGEGAKWWWSAVKGGGFFGASIGNIVDNGVVAVRVVAKAETSMRWRPVSPTTPPIGFERRHVKLAEDVTLPFAKSTKRKLTPSIFKDYFNMF
ncbi:hypothetical protein LR48_Vigan02g161000 [Vigna angularis]|uniref:Uncharacterized protein n=1 Tax=Phaseolus angularis TaxID=3914 RepID=A0A0L9TY56_PHAAN|nr:hypothetical protein LR48_Vigan02g161000 [Vigna angularis]